MDEGQNTIAFHPAVAGVLRFFEYDHLPEGRIRDTARDFADFARSMALHIAPDPELTVALRKLLEAKDAAVRAVVVEEKALLTELADTLKRKAAYRELEQLAGADPIDDGLLP